MIYDNIIEGRFLDRPNRFIAHIEIDGKVEVCHVKNTGRCRELLVLGATVFVQRASNPNRKTKYDLIGVLKNGRIINMDSQIPNYLAVEWLRGGTPYFENPIIHMEKKYGNSRFDLYVEEGMRKAFIEVKGVTLEADGVVSFPDAPTERGVKHLNELAACIKEGYEAYVLFVIQMKDVSYMKPNWQTHRAFGEALAEAKRAGVTVLAYDCVVTKDSIWINEPVEVRLGEEDEC